MTPLRQVRAVVLDVGYHASRHRFGLVPGAPAYEPGAGHNLPQEKPQDFANAVLELVTSSRP